MTIDRLASAPARLPEAPSGDAPVWHALWTHSHCEQRVHDDLATRGFRAFLPKVDVWARRRGIRRLVQTPMFPGYLFLHHAMDKHAYIAVSRLDGLVRLLGERWDRLAVIPDDEMHGIVALAEARPRIFPFPYLKEGQRARITGGPLAGVEGILVETNPQQGYLVLSVHLLQRSVAVRVAGADVTPTV